MNTEYVQNEIQKSLKEIGYLASDPPKNDLDIFPYTEWYQGRHDETLPTILEREAGWNPVEFQRFGYRLQKEVPPPSLCWQTGCSFEKRCN